MIENNGDFKKNYGREIRFLSFGDEKKYLVGSTYRGVDIYTNFDEGNADLKETLSSSAVLTHQMSKDGTYIVFGYSSLKVYIKDSYVKCNI